MIDLTGQTFGRLTVIERAGTKHGEAAWRCRCDCGNEVVVTGHKLRVGSEDSYATYSTPKKIAASAFFAGAAIFFKKGLRRSRPRSIITSYIESRVSGKSSTVLQVFLLELKGVI